MSALIKCTTPLIQIQPHRRPVQVLYFVADQGDEFRLPRAYPSGKLFFYIAPRENVDIMSEPQKTFDYDCDAFGFDGQIPESVIHNFIGMHPDALVDGFTDCIKPAGCDWMVHSRMTNIFNRMGSCLIELEKLQGEA